MSLIRDPASLGVYCYLASKPDNWQINIKELQNRFDKGREFIQFRLSDLKKIGLIQTRCIKNDSGQIVRWETILLNHVQEKSSILHNTENPYCGENPIPASVPPEYLSKNQNTGFPDPGETAPNNKSKIKIKEKPLGDFSNTPTEKSFSDDELFYRFYTDYPRKVKPKEAKKAFKAVVGTNLELLETIICDVARRAKEDTQWQVKKYIPHPASYLRSDYWESEIIVETSPAARPKITQDDIATRMKAQEAFGMERSLLAQRSRQGENDYQPTACPNIAIKPKGQNAVNPIPRLRDILNTEGFIPNDRTRSQAHAF